jgi:hypothetical protein
LDGSDAMEKNKIQNKQISEELYLPSDVLEEAHAARYQMLPKISKLRY